MSTIKQIELTKVQIKVKRPRRFKAGAELSGAVNLVIDLEEGDSPDIRVELTIEESVIDLSCKN